MTTAQVSGPVQELRRLVIAGDLAAVRAHVDSLDGDAVADARSWLATDEELNNLPELDELDHEVRWPREVAARNALAVVIGRLEPPVAAARAIARIWLSSREMAPEILTAVADRGPEWATAFNAAVDATTPRSQGRNDHLATLSRKLAVHHHLSPPTGRLFHVHWIDDHAYWKRWPNAARIPSPT